MKIMHITKKYPSALGGDAVVVSNLRKQQQAIGNKVVIVTSNCDDIKNGRHIYKFGLKDTSAHLDQITIKRLLSLMMLFFQIFSILRKEKPDVIHTHSIDLAFFVSFAARFFAVPVVHTFHIVTFYDENQASIRRKTELWLAKRAGLKHATAPNAYDVGRLRAAGLDQTVLLPNGVDMSFWRGQSNSNHSQDFTFIAIGRLEHQKGYEYLIEAAWELRQTQPSFKIIIVGEGSQYQSLSEHISDLELDDHVVLVGRKSPEEIRVLFSRADAAVFPSLYETTPLTLLEAWAAAVPVITTSVGIVREVSSDFGAAYIVPPQDEHTLMLAMHQCMVDDKRRLMIAAKGHKEAKKYTWPIITQTAQAIYRGVT